MATTWRACVSVTVPPHICYYYKCKFSRDANPILFSHALHSILPYGAGHAVHTPSFDHYGRDIVGTLLVLCLAETYHRRITKTLYEWHSRYRLRRREGEKDPLIDLAFSRRARKDFQSVISTFFWRQRDGWHFSCCPFFCLVLRHEDFVRKLQVIFLF